MWTVLRDSGLWCWTNPRRCLQRVAWFALVTLLMFWAFDRAPPRTEMMGVPTEPAFRPGENFEGLWRFTVRRRDCEGTSVRWVTTASAPDRQIDLDDLHITEDQGLGPKTPIPIRRTVDVRSFLIPSHWPTDQPGAAEAQSAYHVKIKWYCYGLLFGAVPNLVHWVFPIVTEPPVIPFKVLPSTGVHP